MQQYADGAGRAYLADQVHHSDVDTQFQGGGRHADLDLSTLQFLLSSQAGAAGETAVVSNHGVASKTVGELMGDPLHKTAGIHEDQSGVMPPDQVCDFIQRLRPHLMGGHRAQFPLG